MTHHGPAPEDPGTRSASPQVPAPRLWPEDLLELREPDGMPDPYCDFGPPHLPPNAVVIDQIRGLPGAPPSLAELVESIRAREPDTDPEAEP